MLVLACPQMKVSISRCFAYSGLGIALILSPIAFAQAKLPTQASLAEVLLAQLPEAKPAALQDFLRQPENRLQLAQWRLMQLDEAAREENRNHNKKLQDQREKLRDELKDLEQQLASSKSKARTRELKKQLEPKKEQLDNINAQIRLPQILSELARNEQATAIFNEIWNNIDLLELMLDSGPGVYPAQAIGYMAYALQNNEKFKFSDKATRDIVIATGLEFARSRWALSRAADRVQYYVKNAKLGRLHSSFDKLPFWQRRMVCGAKGDNNFGTNESLQWQLDNVHIPVDQYTASCWRGAYPGNYRTQNALGDSIHGPMYYTPFEDVFGKNIARATYMIGGVCGNLSHSGAFAALANGVPAYTMGEPGHCAFTVLVNGEWVAGYSVSWERTLHWSPWQGTRRFAALPLANAYYAKPANVRASMAAAGLALLTAKKDPEAAKAYYQLAAQVNGCNYGMWQDYAQLLTDTQAPTKDWLAYNNALCTGMAATSPEMTADLLRAHVYPNIAQAKASDKEKALIAFWQKAKELGPNRWQIDDFIMKQALTLGENEDAICRFYELLIKESINSPAYAPIAIAWGSTQGEKMASSSQKRITKATMEAIGSTGEGDGAREQIIGQAIIGAEKMRDRSTFQTLSKLLPDKYRRQRIAKFEPFPGQIMSEGGLLAISSTGSRDRPCEHAAILSPTGGWFHTERDVEGWAMVELTRPAHLTGVVVACSNNSIARLKDMKVQVSDTGNDNDWHDVHQFKGVPSRINRTDLGGKKPRARYVRILRPALEPGKAEFFHLEGIIVYGEPAA